VGNIVKTRESNLIELQDIENAIEMQLNRVILGEQLKDKGAFLHGHWQKATGLYLEIIPR
jgi:hypothetical protein